MSYITAKTLPDLHLKKNSVARTSTTLRKLLEKKVKTLGVPDEVVFGPAYPFFLKDYNRNNIGVGHLNETLRFACTYQITNSFGDDSIGVLEFDKPSISSILFREDHHTLTANIKRSYIVNNTPITNTMDLVRIILNTQFEYMKNEYTLSAIDFVMENYDINQRRYTLYARSDSLDVMGSLYIERDDTHIYVRPLT